MRRRTKNGFSNPMVWWCLLGVIAVLATACAGEVASDHDEVAGDDHRDVGVAVQALVPPVSSLPVVVVRLNEMGRTTTNGPFGMTWSDFFFRTTPGTRNLQMYFWTMSNGRFSLNNAGVFSATISPAFDQRAGVNASDVWDVAKAKRAIRALRDNNFSFANYDTRPRDGRITPNELVIFAVEPGHSSGAMRGTFHLSGGDRTISTWLAAAGDQSQFVNYAHELAHTWGMLDLYGTPPCIGRKLTLASCTGGSDNQADRYYLDPLHRRDFGWYLSGEAIDRDVLATPNGSALLAPASATLTRPTGSVRALFLRSGADHYVFEQRRRDGSWDNEVAVEGAVAWFMRRGADGQPLPPKHWYGDVHPDYIFPVAADACHIDEVSGRGPVEAIVPGTYLLRSSKTAWNVRLTVSARNAQGLVPISWQTVANVDDNRCQPHKAQSASQVVSRVADAIDVPRSRFNTNQSRSSGYTASSGWRTETPPTAGFQIGTTVTVSDGTNLVRAFASDHMGRLVMATRNNGAWSSWTALTSANEMPALAPVTAVSRGAGLLDVFWIGNDSTLRSVAAYNGSFSAPFRIHGNDFYNNTLFTPGGRITAISRNRHNIHVFSVAHWFGNPILLDNEWRAHGGWRFSAVLSGGDVRPQHQIAAVARTRERLDVVTSNGNGTLRYAARHFSPDDLFDESAYSGSIGPSMGLASQSPLAIVSRVPYQIDVFGVDTQGRVVSSYVQDSWPWGPSFPITAANAARAQSPNTQLGAVARASNHLDVFVNGPDGNVASSWWHEGIGWSEFALPF